MPQAMPDAPAIDSAACIDQFESAWLRHGRADLAEFVPPSGHFARPRVLRELIRVDLDHGWIRGRPRRLEDYLRDYPEIAEDSDFLSAIAFEEFQRRRKAGEAPAAGDYERCFGVGVADCTLGGATVLAANSPAAGGICGDYLPSSSDVNLPHTPIFLADDEDGNLPEAGRVWQGFHLLHELGRGAFGRVFLARQNDLANRLVALKVCADLFGESQTLAQLQHTNIVPIYSVHQSGRFQALCMPYFGATTLADLLHNLESGESLPASGKALIGTLHNRHNVTVKTVIAGASAAASVEPSAARTEQTVPKALAAGKSKTALETLEKLTYVEAVLWVGARLAEGLAHAHDQGVVHRDLKPANVLLTDDGQPMLLDFNLSQNSHLAAPASRVGGTLPYMAPEHLEAFQGLGRVVDARSDLYSLGVILFELLTGRPPFPRRTMPIHELLPLMIADRVGSPPRLQRWNKAVSPAAEAIVRRCLEPDPARRYASARKLIEDLERQRDNLPLRHTPEPSLAERTRKWTRRHPRFLTSALVAIVAAVLVLAPAVGYVARENHLTRAANDTRDLFLPEKKAAEALLSKQDPSRRDLTDGTEHARNALKLYDALEPSWPEQTAFRYLPDREQGRTREDVQDLQVLLAGATAARGEDDPDHRDELLRSALTLNVLAEQTAGDGSFSKAGWLQRADLARRLGRADEADEACRRADATMIRTARDCYLLGAEAVAKRRFQEALPNLRKATELDPQCFEAWYCQGVCLYEVNQYAEAVECYRAAVALWPDDYKLRVNRALVYKRQGRLDEAEKDLDEAVRLAADSGELAGILAERGQLRGQRGQHSEAVKDLTLALEKDPSLTWIYFARAAERELAGDAVGAREDRQEGERNTPTDEKGWTVRGYYRAKINPEGALSDFEEALKCNPRYLEALQDKAHVLSDNLNKNDAALEVIDREIALYPDFVKGRIGRAVLLARLGRTKEAVEDAELCLKQSTDPATAYQAANVYALAKPLTVKDRTRALDLLSAALLNGFGLDEVDKDTDFDPIRKDPEFTRRVEAARTLKQSASAP
jgi:eukaryotic-like serine/threonine-protein kinase